MLKGAFTHFAGYQVHRRGADEPCHKQIGRVIVDSFWSIQLRNDAFVHHRYPVGQGHRFDLVMGHVNRGDLQFMLQMFQLGTHVDPQFRVEIGERFVHQENGWSPHDGSCQSNPLALTS